MELSKRRDWRSWLAVVSIILFVASACRHAERNLAGEYKLIYMSGREVRIARPDRYVNNSPSPSVMLAGNVKRYAVRDPYITGYADTQYLDLSAEPDARSGYFLIDTKSDMIVAYGMDENQWRKELERISWGNPSLREP
jgi:hypothetical protein